VSGSDSFVCDRFEAAFISPVISNLISNDATIDTFSFTHADSRSFSFVCQLLRGESIFVDEANLSIFESLIEDLCNPELSEFVFTFVDEWNPLTILNCISRLTQKVRLGIDMNAESAFIAFHFSEMNLESIHEIEIDVLSSILGLESLRISNEDWLLAFIIELGPLYFELLGSVRFEYLNSSSIDLFFKHIEIEDIDSTIWTQLWHRSRH
jgi:hypothetical protein